MKLPNTLSKAALPLLAVFGIIGLASCERMPEASNMRHDADFRQALQELEQNTRYDMGPPVTSLCRKHMQGAQGSYAQFEIDGLVGGVSTFPNHVNPSNGITYELKRGTVEMFVELECFSAFQGQNISVRGPVFAEVTIGRPVQQGGSNLPWELNRSRSVEAHNLNIHWK